MANTIGWGDATKNNTNGFGKYQNTIGAGSVYEVSYGGETALVGTSASFLYSKSSYNQGEADPTPTITGTAGGSFNASANVVFVDTGTFNSSTGQIDLSATGIGSHIITYTVNGVQSGQTVGVESIPYQSTSSFTFDGINDYFDCGAISQIPSATTLTISCWLNANSITTNQVVWADDSSSYIFSFEFAGAANKIYFEYAPGYVAIDLNSVITVGSWHNVIMVYDANGAANTDKIKFYIDGVDKSSSMTYTGTIPSSLSANIGKFFIGYGTAYNKYFSGNLDEVSIWNTALSSDAITEIASGPNDLTTLTNASNTNLKAWYKL